MDKAKLGIIGCGNISGAYLKNFQRLKNVEVVAVADLDLARAREKAEEFKVPKAVSVDELLADKSIVGVVNLTVPKAHVAVDEAILRAGKHVYAEKPLGVNRDEARRMLDLAASKKLRVGSAPDTFLGGGLQTCRKLVDDGWIGRPLAATAFMAGPGMERWHPNPDFFFKPGAGPMFDMGPYYLTAMISMLGPARRVCAINKIGIPERTIQSQPLAGTKIKVETPTHITGALEFASGVVATMIMSFEVWSANLPRIEIHGTDASLSVPDPNTFGGPVRIFKPAKNDWMDVPLSHGYTENWRGLGMADMMAAEASGRKHRASGALAFHVLDIMQSFLEASECGRTVEITSSCERPAPMPLGLLDGEIES